MFILTGKLHHKFDMVVKSERFRKLEFILSVNYNRPNDDLVKFMATGTNCDVVDSISLGTFMDVSFFISGRAHVFDGKTVYYTNLEVISINYHPIDYSEPKKEEKFEPNDILPF